MNKKIVMLGLVAMIVVISCKFIKKDEKPQGENEGASNLVLSQVSDPTPAPSGTTPPPKPPTQPAQPLEQAPNPAPTGDGGQKPLVRQFDSKKLDDEVREEALKMGKDPARYRKIIRIDPDGSKIYRQIGMHVIVSPNQEEVFLPDEI